MSSTTVAKIMQPTDITFSFNFWSSRVR